MSLQSLRPGDMPEGHTPGWVFALLLAETGFFVAWGIFVLVAGRELHLLLRALPAYWAVRCLHFATERHPHWILWSTCVPTPGQRRTAGVCGIVSLALAVAGAVSGTWP